MIEIDGGQHWGSGTLVRYGMALAALCGAPVRLVNACAPRRTSEGIGRRVARSLLEDLG